MAAVVGLPVAFAFITSGGTPAQAASFAAKAPDVSDCVNLGAGNGCNLVMTRPDGTTTALSLAIAEAPATANEPQQVVLAVSAVDTAKPADGEAAPAVTSELSTTTETSATASDLAMSELAMSEPPSITLNATRPTPAMGTAPGGRQPNPGTNPGGRTQGTASPPPLPTVTVTV